jgi:hypothetical protein
MMRFIIGVPFFFLMFAVVIFLWLVGGFIFIVSGFWDFFNLVFGHFWRWFTKREYGSPE